MNFPKKHKTISKYNKYKILNNIPFIFTIKSGRLNSKLVSKTEYKQKTKKNFSGVNRHFVPAIKEWYNSVYAYKSHVIKLLPSSDKAVFNIIKSYFNFYSINQTKNARSIRARRRNRRYSFKRLIVGRPNFKHTNKNVTVIIYLYNRRIKYLTNQINRMATLDNISIKNYSNLIKHIKEKLSPLYKYKKMFNVGNYSSTNSRFMQKDITNLMNKYLSLEINSILLRQLTFIEKSKFDKYYLLPLIKLIEIIYKKKIIFNVINIKYIYNSASILAYSIVNKLRKRKRNPLKALEKVLDMFKLPPVNRFSVYEEIYNKNAYVQNMKLKDLSYTNIPSTFLGYNDIVESLVNDKNVDNYENNINRIINLLKYKFSTGVRVEIAGRLTRRNTAERAIHKLKYRGNIQDPDSSLKNLSSTLLRGYAKSSVQFVRAESKLRIGSFGVKTWVNSN